MRKWTAQPKIGNMPSRSAPEAGHSGHCAFLAWRVQAVLQTTVVVTRCAPPPRTALQFNKFQSLMVLAAHRALFLSVVLQCYIHLICNVDIRKSTVLHCLRFAFLTARYHSVLYSTLLSRVRSHSISTLWNSMTTVAVHLGIPHVLTSKYSLYNAARQ